MNTILARHSSSRWCIYKLILTSFIVLVTLSSSAQADGEKISTALAQALDQTDGPLPIIVLLKAVPLAPQQLLMQMSATSVEQLMKQRALQMQSDLRSFVNEIVSKPGLDGQIGLRHYQFFWAVNGMMAIASRDMIVELADREDVQAVLYDKKIRLAPDFRSEDMEAQSEYTYGLQKIGVPALREKLPQITGEGVTVGIVDTGIDAQHPELQNKVIEFKDFANSQEKPYDDNGHGTHVAGTISGGNAGGTQIGVAPGVKLVIAKVFTSDGSATTSNLLRAMEWVADPTGDKKGTHRPRVVNNSWGGSMPQNIRDDAFNQAVTTWVQLNIFPSFAAGNAGPDDSTVGSPGGLPQAVAAGATNESDEIADFSSRGPVKVIVDDKLTTYVKPDVAAPGYEVYSSMPDGKYGKMSGTSMATPHLTGAVALLVQVHPEYSVAQLKEALTKSADHLGQGLPNNTFGFGRLNILNAVSNSSSTEEQSGE